MVNVNITDKYSAEIHFLNSIKIYYSAKDWIITSLLQLHITNTGDFFFTLVFYYEVGRGQVRNNTTGHEDECKGKRAWQTSEHGKKDDKNIR